MKLSEQIRAKFNGADDIVYTELSLRGGFPVLVVFCDGMTNSKIANDDVLKPISELPELRDARTETELVERIMDGAVYHCQRKLYETADETIADILFGGVALVFDRTATAVVFDSKGFESRSVGEPTSEHSIKGAKEGFVENLRTNTAIVRRRLQTPDLKVKQYKIGRRTATSVAVMYFAGVANSGTLAAIDAKLADTDIDGLASASQFEAILYGRLNTMFPQALYTERPDRFVGNLLEGRIGIVIDGLPFCYITPVDFNSFLQASDDYAQGAVTNSVYRALRYICTLLSLILPAFYVAITTFHQEMLPTKLALSIIQSKQGVPFPTFVEVLLMLLSFEVLLEAGLHLPATIGQSVSIIGGLVVGQAAVQASLLSPGVVIIIALSGVTGFAIPSQDMARILRMSRLALVLLASVGGLFTLVMGLIFILYQMCTIEIFGTPYVAPFGGNDYKQLFDDTIFRVGWTDKTERPVSIAPEDKIRAEAPGEAE
ncbi:MAG: spore germination protein [Oscillospiraceae bacterium]|jgi:spore germination protein KA|nr:spore germination protein [Oscillospiraceae bacterium]